MSQNNNPQSSIPSDVHWTPNYPEFNLLGGSNPTLTALATKANRRSNFSANELGVDAGRAVLDEYYNATGETSKGTVVRATFSFHNAVNASAGILPLVGFGAALAVDAAIFGAAGQALTPESELPFNAFTFGSLIFATALGLTEKYQNTSKKMFLYFALITASTGAAFIAANNNEFRANFTDTIRSGFETGYDDEKAIVDGLKIEIKGIQDKIQQKETQINTGGNNRMNMLADGATGNDDLANQLKTEIDKLEERQSIKESELAKATPELEQATRKDWADLVGRLLATSYIAAWLIAAQLLLAEIVRTASNNFSQFRDGVTERTKQKKFVKDIENPDEEKRNAVIKSSVSVMLSRFSEILSKSSPNPQKPEKHDNFAALFEKAAFDEMVEAGVEVVKGTIKPKQESPSFAARIQSIKNTFRKRTENNDSIISDDASEIGVEVPKANSKSDLEPK
jgi:hypothetical protein